MYPCIHLSPQATAGLLFYLLRAQPIVAFYKLNVHAGEHIARNVKETGGRKVAANLIWFLECHWNSTVLETKQNFQLLHSMVAGRYHDPCAVHNNIFMAMHMCVEEHHTLSPW